MVTKLGHLSNKRNLIIISLILVVIVAGCSGFYYFNKIKPYNDLLTSANKAVTTEDYDNAINFYTEAETYKKTSNVDKKIQFMGVLKKSKENYESAMQKMKSKDYLSAVDIFKNVDKQDTKRYSDSQNKINECKKIYVSDNLAKAKDDIKNNKFDEASVCLNNIFKLDANNSDAKKLKGDIADGQKQNAQAGTTQNIENQKNNISKTNNEEYTPEMAIKAALEKDNLQNDSNVAAYCGSAYYANGKKYFEVRLKNKIYMKDGGSGTIDNFYVDENGNVYQSISINH